MGHTSTPIDGKMRSWNVRFHRGFNDWELGVGELLSKSSLLTLGEWDVIE